MTKAKSAVNYKPVVMGCKAKDLVSGFTGIVTSKMEYLNGNIQWGIQPTGKGDDLPEAYGIDEHLVEYVDDGIIDRVTPPGENHITLGNVVEDIVTGFKGHAVMFNTFSNGCIKVGVKPKAAKSDLLNENARESYVDYKQLKVIKEGVANTIDKAPLNAEGKAPGGPNTRMKANRIPR